MNASQIKFLEYEIIKHRKLYYFGHPEISDTDYDQLERELLNIDESNRLFNEVGFDIEKSSFKKVEHDEKMGSQGKVYTVDEFNGWFDNHTEEFVMTPKIDGLALSITYKYQSINGMYMLQQGLTRGNGFIGEDITENVKMVSNIPKSINLDSYRKNGIVNDIINFVGEVYISKHDFKNINDKLELNNEDTYSNCRNLASGSLRQKNPKITKQRTLSFFCYGVKGINTDTYVESLDIAKESGFGVVDYRIINFDKIFSMHEDVSDVRDKIDYDIDGTVVRLNDNIKFEKMGVTSHHPKGSVAIKFEPETGQSILKDVEWDVSRTGLINPVAMIDPVELNDTIVKRATLHNLSHIKRLNLQINCGIIVSKQGDVIPKILKKEYDGDKEIIIPTECPSCGEQARINISDSGIETLMCDNDNCSAKLVSKYVHFCKVMNMKSIAESTIEKIVKNEYISSVADLFTLNYDQLIQINGFKKKSVENIINTIQFNRVKPFKIVLQSFGLKHIGNTVSELLSTNYSSIEDIISAGSLEHIDGIGSGMSEDIINGLISNKNIINEVLDYVSIETVKINSIKLDSKLFCLSGGFSKGKNTLKKMITKNGGIVKSSVVKNLDYLVAGPGSGSKSDKAKSLNIPILTEDELLAMLGEEIDKSNETNNQTDHTDIMSFIK